MELPTSLKPQLLETTPFDMNKLQPDLQVKNKENRRDRGLICCEDYGITSNRRTLSSFQRYFKGFMAIVGIDAIS